MVSLSTGLHCTLLLCSDTVHHLHKMSFHKIYNLIFFVACYWLSLLEDREFIHLIKVCSLINQNKFKVLPSAWLNMNIKQASAKMKAVICGKTSRVKLAHHSSCQYNYSSDWLLVFYPLGWNDLRMKPGVLFIFFNGTQIAAEGWKKL